MQKFIIIELMDPNFPVIVTGGDGYPMIFHSEEAAVKEADNCQDPIIVFLPK